MLNVGVGVTGVMRCAPTRSYLAFSFSFRMRISI